MTDRSYIAPPLSRLKIESATMAIRRLLGLTDPFLNVAELLEYGLERLAPGYTFDVRDIDEMGGRHGSVDVVERSLQLRLDVYEGILAHRGRDRFTGCHELGHTVFHGTLNRVRAGPADKTYCDPEWQANTFASCLLMPAHMVQVASSVREIVSEFGVSEDAARVRLKVLGLQLPSN